jgi:hypothetical protein
MPSIGEIVPPRTWYLPRYSRSFQGNHIPRIGNDTNHAVVAIGSPTNITDGLRRQVKAYGTKANLGLGLDQGHGQRLDFLFRTLDQMEGETLGRFRADAGEMLQLLDQASEGTRVNRGFDLLMLPLWGNWN